MRETTIILNTKKERRKIKELWGQSFIWAALKASLKSKDEEKGWVWLQNGDLKKEKPERLIKYRLGKKADETIDHVARSAVLKEKTSSMNTNQKLF